MPSRRGQVRGASVGSVLVAVTLSASAWLALGHPDLPAAGDFLTSGRPTHGLAVATVQLVVWVMVAALVLAQLYSALRGGSVLAERSRQRRSRARISLAIGVLVFLGGAAHHQSSTPALCCGDVPRAERLAK